MAPNLTWSMPEKSRMWPVVSGEGMLDALPRGLALTPLDLLFIKVRRYVAAWAEQYGAG